MSNDPERNIVHREIDPDAENPAVEVANIVADIEDKEATELANMYECIDHVLDNIFSNPPAPEAQLMVEFTYEDYRITIEQDGHGEFMKVD